jgi:hypothetical protein
LAATFLTPAESGDTLVKFYRKVRPQITGWKPVAKLGGDEPVTRDLGRNLLSWMLGCILIYSALFCIGELCFGRYGTASIFGVVAIVCALAISRLMPTANEWQSN